MRADALHVTITAMGTRKPIPTGGTSVRTSDKAQQTKSAGAKRVQRHRDALRAKGLRPVTLWVPDTKDPAFIAEYQRQSRLLGMSPHEDALLDWMETVEVDAGAWE